MKYYIFEYNDKLKLFHCNDRPETVNTFGWVTICEKLSSKQCHEFVMFMELKYDDNFPNINIVREDFKIFLAKSPMTEKEIDEFWKYVETKASY